VNGEYLLVDSGGYYGTSGSYVEVGTSVIDVSTPDDLTTISERVLQYPISWGKQIDYFNRTESSTLKAGAWEIFNDNPLHFHVDRSRHDRSWSGSMGDVSWGGQHYLDGRGGWAEGARAGYTKHVWMYDVTIESNGNEYYANTPTELKWVFGESESTYQHKDEGFVPPWAFIGIEGAPLVRITCDNFRRFPVDKFYYVPWAESRRSHSFTESASSGISLPSPWGQTFEETNSGSNRIASDGEQIDDPGYAADMTVDYCTLIHYYKKQGSDGDKNRVYGLYNNNFTDITQLYEYVFDNSEPPSGRYPWAVPLRPYAKKVLSIPITATP
jgi:hypothetical protein